MVNHDLTTLFLIARTILPFDFLNAILYGKFEDATEDDINSAKEIVANANRDKEAFDNQFEEQVFGQLDETIGGGDEDQFGTIVEGNETTH